MAPKKGFIAPYIRFQWNQNKNLIGKEANIYQVSDSQFIIAIGNEFKPKDLSNSHEKGLYNLSNEINRFKLKNEDLNASTTLIGCRETLVRDRARGLVGYDVALTRRRSPVRIRPGPYCF